jgi:hypothetical protein
LRLPAGRDGAHWQVLGLDAPVIAGFQMVRIIVVMLFCVLASGFSNAQSNVLPCAVEASLTL